MESAEPIHDCHAWREYFGLRMTNLRKVFCETFGGEPTLQSEEIWLLNLVGQDFQPAERSIE